MSFTPLLFEGFELGGQERFSSLSGSSSIVTTVRTEANGVYAYKKETGAGDDFIDIYEFQNSSNGNAKGFGFWINPTIVISNSAIFVTDSSNASKLRFTFDTNDGGAINLRDSVTELVGDILTGADGIWSFIEVWYEEGTDAAWEVFVNGVSKGSGSGANFLAGNSAKIKFFGSVSNSVLYDDIYFGEATAASDLKGGMDIFATVGDGSATTGGDALDAGTFPNVQEIPKNDTNLASYNAPTGNTDEREAPDTIVVQTNLTGVVGDIDDDPDAPDGNWLTASGSSTLRNTFPTPTGEPTIGAGLQEFRVLMRKDATGPAGGGTEDVLPTGITTQTGLSGAVTLIDDDPDSPDGDTAWSGDNGWMVETADNSVLQVSMANPTNGGSIDESTDAQVVKVFLRKDASGGGTPSYTLEVHDSGGLHETLVTDQSIATAGELDTYNWTAAGISSPDDIEIKLISTKGGGGPNVRSIEVDAIRWEMAFGGSETQPGFEIKLYENGSEVTGAGSATGNLTDAGGDTVAAFTWDATELATADGSLVECYVNQTSGADRFIEIGAVEWNCKFPVAKPAESGWIEADSGSKAGPSDVSGLNEIVGLTTYIRSQFTGSGSTLAHSLYRGNDVDGVTELSLGDATASLADFFDITASASIMPLITEQTRVGFGHPVDVDVDIDCTEIIGMVAHIPGLGAISASPNLVFSAAADLKAKGKLDASTTLVFSAAADLNARGKLDAPPALVLSATADLEGRGKLDASPTLVFGGTADLKADDKISASPALVFAGATVDLKAIGKLSAWSGAAAPITALMDGSVVFSDTDNAWDDDANAIDGSTSTFASNTDPVVARQLRMSGNDITPPGGQVLQVEMRSFVSSVDGTSAGNNQLRYAGDTLLNQPWSNSVAGWTAWELTVPPTGGWSPIAITNMQCRVTRTSGTGELRLYKVEVRVRYSTGGFSIAADLTAQGKLDASAALALTLAAGLLAKGKLDATAALIFSSTADLKAKGKLDATPDLVFSAVAALIDASGPVQITATPALVFSATADLEGIGKLDATPNLIFAAAADLKGTGKLDASPTLLFSATADLNALGTLGAAAALIFSATADLNAKGKLDASPTLVFSATADLEGIGKLDASPTLTFTQTADLTSTHALDASPSLVFSATADLKANGKLDASPALVFSLGASLINGVEGALNASPDLIFSAAADLEAKGKLDASTTIVFSATADLKSIGKLQATASPTLIISVTADLEAKGKLDASPALVFSTAADLIGRGKLDASPSLTISVPSAGLKGGGPLTASPALTFTQTADLKAKGALSASPAMVFSMAAPLIDITGTKFIDVAITAAEREIAITCVERDIIITATN